MKKSNPAYYYYYLRDPVSPDYKSPKHMKKKKALGFPRITVCIGVKKTDDRGLEVARGLALCSPSEPTKKISKQYGREKAKGMVMKALFLKDNTEDINRVEATDSIHNAVVGRANEELVHPESIESFFGCRSSYNPVLTVFEQKLTKISY